jgi:hypothetical protein
MRGRVQEPGRRAVIPFRIVIRSSA